MTDLLGKKRFQWNAECDAAFEKLKTTLAKPLKLHRPDPTLPYILQTDASERGMGAVLLQETAEGDRRIIACASAKFSRAENKYHCNEQEVLAALWGCRRYKTSLEHQPFILRSDSRALQWLRRYQDDRAKLTRWALQLQEYNFQVEHCPGRENQLADFLSRNPRPEEEAPQEDAGIERIAIPEDTTSDHQPATKPVVMRHTRQIPTNQRRRPPRNVPLAFVQPIVLNQHEVNEEPTDLYTMLANAQRTSTVYQGTRARWHRLKTGQEEANQNWQKTLRDQYEVHDNLIWYVGSGHRALVVPCNYWPRVIHHYHDSIAAGHPGRDETIAAITRLYYWPAVKKQVKTHVKHCLLCASTKHGGAHQPHAPLRPRLPQRPWQTLSLDIMGPYPLTRSGNRYLLVTTDLLSRWVEARPANKINTQIILAFLDDVCHRWGFPEQVITDNAAQFRSAAWASYLRKKNIAGYTSPVYHQQANPVERRNQEVKKLLRVRLHNKPEDQWDLEIPGLLFTLHNRTNSATGMSPSEALLGTQLTQPGDQQHPTQQAPVHNRAQDRQARIEQARARQIIFTRNLYPEPREAPVHFRAGDMVLTRAFPGKQPPFGPKWDGPFPILAVKGEGVYEVDRNGAQFIIHIDDIRPAPDPAPEIDQEQEEATLLPVRQDDLPGEDSDNEDPGPETITISAQVHTDPGTTPAVQIQDLPDDRGDPDEAQPQEGRDPIIGLYP